MLTSNQASEEAGVPEKQPKAGWQKAELPELTPSTTAEVALTEIILGCVEHLRGNEACVLSREHEEGIHQMRVASRRLRSCLALYGKFIPSEQLAYLTGELKWLIGELGPARDWDVFVADGFTPVTKQLEADRLTELGERIESLRDEAYMRAQAAVGSQRYLGLVLLLHSWAEGKGWRDTANGGTIADEMQTKAFDLAHELLHERYQQLVEAGANFEQLDAEQRHKVRIQLKKLRYATEFFSSLYPKQEVTPYLADMKALQDDLGESNDVDVARKLLKRVLKKVRGKQRAGLSYAAGLVVGWHSHIGDGREQHLIEAWGKFAAKPPYWDTEPADAPEDASKQADVAANDGGDGASPPAMRVAGEAPGTAPTGSEAPAPKSVRRRRPAARPRSPQQG